MPRAMPCHPRCDERGEGSAGDARCHALLSPLTCGPEARGGEVKSNESDDTSP